VLFRVDMQYMVNQLAFDMFHALKPIRGPKHVNYYDFLHHCGYSY